MEIIPWRSLKPRKNPPFIVMPTLVVPLREGERLTVAGEGVDEDDLDTLAGGDS
ncbi:hypothetical protein DPMN_055245 [Dreissena polymorpha]|uniref:Uncharacterized protein n=1 Tax=Dreissena polymorpha TaxID=45954 RepID=A0A9D4CS01_DREPO|nr:hypothetical protein DPMN_055245 [Dreissena polymorpha]